MLCFQIKKVKTKRKKTVQESPTSEEIKDSSGCDSLPTPSPSKPGTSSKPQRKTSIKSTATKKKGDEEKTFVRSMTKTINNMNDMVTNKSPQDEHDMWAKVLASKVRRMDADKRDEFKLKVDTLALSYLHN